MKSEYERIYEPKLVSNTCCTLCKNCVDGCSWARSFEPIPGWGIRNAVSRDRTDGIKILYCPEFIEGDPLDNRESDANGILALFGSVCKLTALDYAEAIKAKYNAEKEAHSRSLSEADKRRLYATIDSAEASMQCCESFLGRYAAPLKRQILAKLKKTL